MNEYFDEQLHDDESIDLLRYIQALARRWWLIALISLGIIVPWLLYLRNQPPTYETEIWISFEGARVTPEVAQHHKMKLRSRTFAEEVTGELGLTLEIIQDPSSPNLGRQDVFKTFSTTKEPVTGEYALIYYPSGYAVLYHDSERLDSLLVEDMDAEPVSHNGLTLSIHPDIAEEPLRINFRIRDFQNTARSLQSRERVEFTGDLMMIRLQGKDPILLSETLNMLAGIFIDKTLELEKERTRFMSNYLKDQLDVVQRELAKTDMELKGFRNSYIQGLNTTTNQTIGLLDAYERRMSEFRVHKEQLELLLNKLDPASVEFESNVSLPYIYRQIARLPVFKDDAEMTIVRAELADLDAERDELLETFPITNPTVLEISENIQSAETKITELARKKVDELDGEIARDTASRDSVQLSLAKLPNEELRFIQLERQRKLNEDLYNLYLRRYREARISEDVAYENVSILDPALPPTEPIRAGKQKKALLGVFMGLGLGLGAAFIIELSDKRIKTHEDVKRYLKLPILGSIPMVKFDDYELQDSEKAKSISSQIVTHDYSPTPVGEAYRALRTNLLFSKRVGPIRSLVIGSVSPGEGKSFTAANLAITLAQQKSRTLLVDADLRRGVLHNSFNCPKKPGLTNYLTGVVPLEDVLNETYIPNLTLITCGSLIPNPSELLGSVKMRRFIEGIIKRFDFVIFDSPPLMAATDAVILGTLVDGTAVVIRAGKTNRDDVLRRLEIFQNVQAKVHGAILNCAGVEVAHEGYSYYRY